MIPFRAVDEVTQHRSDDSVRWKRKFEWQPFVKGLTLVTLRLRWEFNPLTRLIPIFWVTLSRRRDTTNSIFLLALDP